MTQSNNDIEELEELLTELEGQEAQLVRPYAEDDDAVTQLMDAPLGDQEWMVQVTALDRRMMSTDQVVSELRAGKLSNRTLVWRGGMDDWLPIARVDSLSREGGMSQAGVSQGGMPSSGAPSLSASASSRLGAPAPLPAPPMWATLPSAAPLPPPPAALPPLVGLPSSSAPMGLPPAAAAPSPPPSEPSSPRPVSLPPPPPMTSAATNTARPVAIDFSEMAEDSTSPLRGKRAILALSAVAVLAVFLSVYALSSKSDGTATTASAEQPRSVAALQPSTAEKKSEAVAEPAVAKPAEPAAAPTPAPKPAESEIAANDPSASSGNSARTTAPARYSPRSEYRRRSRGGAERAQDDAESSAESAAPEAPAPRSPAPRSTVAARAPAEEEASASEAPPPASGGAADDADATEAPKSTGGKANTFNREAAKAALAEAAAQAKNCRPAGGPSGTGRVEVHYEPSGKVSTVNILTSKFENTTTGSCVRMLFRRAKVPEFTGAPVVTVSKSFDIP